MHSAAPDLVSPEATERIRAVRHLRESIYRDLDIPATLDYFTRRYVRPLSRWFDLANCSIVDAAAGHGWFSFAYLLAGGRSSVASDLDRGRLDAAREIAEILGLADRMNFVAAPIQDLPLEEDSAEIFVSIETLEHVGRPNIRPALERIARVASKGALITTPNRFFPAIAHDTRLPFAHWLPKRLRQAYADLAGRGELNENCDFVSPLDLRVLAGKFEPVSRCLQFAGFEDFLAHYPYYLPYEVSQRWQYAPSQAKSAYLRLVSALFGRRSHWFMPSLARVYMRRTR